MCTKAEVAEVVSSKLAPINVVLTNLTSLVTKIETVLSALPCGTNGEKLVELKYQYEALKESSEKFEKEKNEEFYPRLRDTETSIATLTEQNKGQDAWSAKVWAIILIVITVISNTLSWFFRG